MRPRSVNGSRLEAVLVSQCLEFTPVVHGQQAAAPQDVNADRPNDSETSPGPARPLGEPSTFAERRRAETAASIDWRDQVVAMIPTLRAFAFSLSRNSADADDLVQDTLIKAWTHRDKFELGTNLRAWLFTILRNTYYTAVVRRRREVADEDGKHAARLSTAPTQQWSVAMRALQAALQRLPDEHREALVLVGAAGLSYEEAAQICACALGTIKSRVNRARNRLVKLMETDEGLSSLMMSSLSIPMGREPQGD